MSAEQEAPASDPHSEPYLVFAVFLATLGAMCLTIAVMGNWLGFPLIHYALPVAVLPCAVLVYGYFFRPSWENTVAGLLMAAFLIVIGMKESNVLDFMQDGMAYHQPSVEALAKGWNPLREEGQILWQRIYPSGAWSVEACLTELLQSPEAGKSFYFWWLFIAIPVLLAGLRQVLGKRGFYHEVLVWLCILNPVVIGQVLTHYVDGMLYLEGITFIGALLIAGESPVRDRIAFTLMATALLFIINTKISGIYFATVLCTAAVLYLWQQQRVIPRKTIAFFCITGAVSTLVFGYHPYVTSLLRYGSLFPMDPASLVAGIIPANYETLPVPLRSLYSLFSVTGGSARRPAVLKWPWELQEGEWGHAMTSPLSGGFGGFFAAGFLLAVMLVAVKYFSTRGSKDTQTIHKGMIILAGSLFMGSVVFPDGWWARLAPFTYAVPFFMIFALRGHTTKQQVVLQWLFLGIFAMNDLSAGLGMVVQQVIWRDNFCNAVSRLHEANPKTVLLVPVYAGENYKNTTLAYTIIQRRLQEQGITSVVESGAPCTHKVASWAEFDVCY